MVEHIAMADTGPGVQKTGMLVEEGEKVCVCVYVCLPLLQSYVFMIISIFCTFMSIFLSLTVVKMQND